MNRTVFLAIGLAGCGSITPYTFDTDNPVDGTDVDTDGTVKDSDKDDDTDIKWTDSDAGSTDTDDDPGPTGTSDAPFIVEIMDGTANPKLRYVEIYNPTNATINLAGWQLNYVAEGVTANLETYVYPNADLASGRTFVVCFDEGATAFTNAFPGKSCDAVSKHVAGDGNDPYTLASPSNSVKDVYGAFSGSGAGQPWEYTDSVAKRKTSIGKGALSWKASEWTITAGQGSANPGNRD